MNNVAFLQLLLEVNDNISLYYKSGLVTVKIDGETWTEQTLDQCINSVKQTLSIKYLQEKQSEK